MSARSPAGLPTVSSATGRWTPGPREPQLTGQAVHVWRVDLTTVGDDVVRSLGHEERERAARIAGERDRLLWSRSRGVLRELLGRYVRTDAAAVELAAGPHGKPELSSAGDSRASLSFNMSHSRHLALYAFTAIGAIGVDVQLARDEHARAATDYVALAKRTFGKRQARRLDGLEPEPREREFLRLWTRHEAELKRRGTGFGGAGARVDSDSPIAPGPDAAPWIVELDVGARASAALALAERAHELRLWSWA